MDFNKHQQTMPPTEGSIEGLQLSVVGFGGDFFCPRVPDDRKLIAWSAQRPMEAD